jgi:hypothetical protein
MVTRLSPQDPSYRSISRHDDPPEGDAASASALRDAIEALRATTADLQDRQDASMQAFTVALARMRAMLELLETEAADTTRRAVNRPPR